MGSISVLDVMTAESGHEVKLVPATRAHCLLVQSEAFALLSTHAQPALQLLC